MSVELRKQGGQAIGCLEHGCDCLTYDYCQVTTDEVLDWLLNPARIEVTMPTLVRRLIAIGEIGVEFTDPRLKYFTAQLDASYLEEPECDHDWVDARNAVVRSGEWCRKCNAIKAGNA